MTADLQTALNTAEQGFHVIPLKPNSKLPAIRDWPAKATTDPATIKRWWTDPFMNWKAPPGVGVVTGQRLVVIDLDVKHDGEASLRFLEFGNGKLKPSRKVKTPSGGWHFYFRTSESFKNSAGKIAPGIDIRGECGYVVGSGTSIKGKAYTIEGGEPGAGMEALVSLPDEWAAELRKASKPGKKARADNATPLAELDTSAAIERAAEWLVTQSPATEGSRNHEGYKAACRLKDFGLTKPTCLQTMIEHWRCEPMLEHEEIEHVVNSAYTYGTEAPGVANPMADFDPVPDIFGTPKQRPPLYAIRYDDVEPDLHTVPLIEDIFDKGAMSVVYGDSNVGKSYVVLDMAYAIATGAPWHGKPVDPGAVVYVAAEGAGSMKHRIKALKTEHGSEMVPMSLVPCPVDLFRRNADTQPLIELIRSEQEHFGQDVCFVAVDTLSRVLAGGNENTAEDMSALVRNLDRLRVETKAHVCIIHHTGKDKSKGARGSSVLRAATDTELKIERGVIKVTKQRDMEATKPLGFNLDTVKIGVNRNGKDVTACVVVPTNVSAAGDFEKVTLPPKLQEASNVLREAINEDGIEPEDIPDERVFGKTVTLTDWRERHKLTFPDRKADARSHTIKRTKEALLTSGQIEIVDEYVWFRS